MSTIQKRLHISGLTPAITSSDLMARLHGFGKVLSLDGLGVLNAVGEPRKYAYVTLEATEPNLARCLNVLSGTTWKGTKLRIGEAKPDYVQRRENERKRTAEDDKQHPSKRRRLPRGVQGVHAADMSLVTLGNLNSHPGWHKTSLSHLIRPMKMRPSRPLPDVSGGQKPTKSTASKKKKPSILGVPTRARLRVIDPRIHEPVHLRESMLEAIMDAHASQSQMTRIPLQSKSTPPPSKTQRARSASPSSYNSDPPSVSKPDVQYDMTMSSAVEEPDASTVIPSFEKETTRDLHLLSTMFGDDQSQWGGKESIDDVMSEGPEAIVAEEVKSTMTTEPMTTEPVPEVAPPGKSKSRMLKDLFQPHEEEAGFSLLAGLGDIDLELDPAFDLDASAAPVSVSLPAAPQPTIPALVAPLQAEGFALDPTLPMFFPHPENPRAVDLFTAARTEGWEFSRTGDSDTIRKRWNETKGTLTREWKKRAREAVKLRKRKHGAPDGEDG